MIGSLRGRLLHRDGQAGEVLIEVAGVGYRVSMTPTAMVAVGDEGSQVFVYVHHAIREADQHLYGFTTLEERTCFESLLGAHGVGPALALAVLGVHTPAQLRLAVATDDVDSLCMVPGVGKKTAARLLIELKNRMDFSDDLEGVVAAVSGGPAGVRSVKGDATQALAGLGYTNDEIRAALSDLPDDGDVSALVRDALQRMATL
ncbi:MAG: Holliday junction branch migration protein RuvA [Actinomycetia bacterium]|nr:Holliday junction branch migration protein RuvA [Actinomycetes bacterium]MCP4961603.1 Holliday junction branch migration protein RuvA [Actinomycetes bacterium]